MYPAKGKPRTLYAALGLLPDASLQEIKSAYEKTCEDNDSDARENLRGSAQDMSRMIRREADAAWAILSDPVTRTNYNTSIDITSPWKEDEDPSQPFGNWYEVGAEATNLGGTTDTSGQATDNEPVPVQEVTKEGNSNEDSNDKEDPDQEGNNEEGSDSEVHDEKVSPPKAADDKPSAKGVYRWAQYKDNTKVLEVMINTWRLELNISSNFIFDRGLTDFSDPDDPSTVRFKMNIIRTDDPPNKMRARRDIKIVVKERPELMRIVELQSLFVVRFGGSMQQGILTLSITAIPCTLFEEVENWKANFDFDLGRGAASALDGTCVILTDDEPPDPLAEDENAPAVVLKEDERIHADCFKNLGADTKKLVRCGDAEMWKVAAMGVGGKYLKTDYRSPTEW